MKCSQAVLEMNSNLVFRFIACSLEGHSRCQSISFIYLVLGGNTEEVGGSQRGEELSL